MWAMKLKATKKFIRKDNSLAAPYGEGWGGLEEGAGVRYVVTGGDWTLGDEHHVQHAGDVSERRALGPIEADYSVSRQYM